MISNFMDYVNDVLTLIVILIVIAIGGVIIFYTGFSFSLAQVSQTLFATATVPATLSSNIFRIDSVHYLNYSISINSTSSSTPSSNHLTLLTPITGNNSINITHSPNMGDGTHLCYSNSVLLGELGNGTSDIFYNASISGSTTVSCS